MGTAKSHILNLESLVQSDTLKTAIFILFHAIFK